MKSKDGASAHDRAAGMVEANTAERISANVVVRCTVGGVAGISVATARRFGHGELNPD